MMRAIVFALLGLVALVCPAQAQFVQGGLQFLPNSSACPYGDAGCLAAPAGTFLNTSAYTTFNTDGALAQSGQTYTSAAFSGSIASSLLTISGIPAGGAATGTWAKGDMTIPGPTGLTLPAGLLIYDSTLSTPEVVGIVSTYNSGTGSIGLLLPAIAASSGSTDALSWKVISSGSETIQGTGIHAGVYISSLGTGTGGNGTYHLADASGLSVSGSMTALRRPATDEPAIDYAVGPTSSTFCDPDQNNTPHCTLDPHCTWSITGGALAYAAPNLTCNSTASLVQDVNFGPITSGSFENHGSTRLFINGTTTPLTINDNYFIADALLVCNCISVDDI